MMGGGSGGIKSGNDPLRNLTTITPSHTGKSGPGGKTARTQQKPDPQGDDKLDRIDRNEGGMTVDFEIVTNDDRRRRRGHGSPDEEIAQPSGHAANRRRFKGEAFRVDADGRRIPPTYSDVDQGNLSDAWLLACFAAVAHSQPAAIMKRFERLPDGAFQVSLGATGFRVTPEFAGEGYADPAPNRQQDTLWCALLEKAFAMREAAAYTNLEVGNPTRALEDLTGKRARRMSLSDLVRPDRIWTALREARRGERSIVFRTKEQGVAQPLQSDHVYAVLDISERDGKRLVRIYNPWGTNGGERTIESMITEVAIDEVIRDGLSFHIAG